MTKNFLQIILLVLTILSFNLYGCSNSNNHEEQTGSNSSKEEAEKELFVAVSQATADRINIVTEKIEKKQFGRNLHITGQITPDVGKETDVATRFTGRILEVKVRPGDQVYPGQILAIVDSHEISTLQAELIEASSKLEITKAHENREKQIYQENLQRPKELIEAKTKLEQAKIHDELCKSEFLRLEGLRKEEIVSEKDFLEAKAAYTKAQLEYKESLYQLQREQRLYENKSLLKRDLHLALAETNRDKQHLDTLVQRLLGLGIQQNFIDEILFTGKIKVALPLIAKVRGTIVHQDASVGELIGPEKKIFTITDLSALQVNAELPEVDLSGIKIGNEVFIHVASYPHEKFRALISYIGDTVSPDTRTVAIRAKLDNAKGLLKVNMAANMELKAAPRLTLVCAKSAVLEKDGHKIVFIKEGDKYKERTLELGAHDENYYEIISGLSEGEEVVVQGSLHLKNELNNKHA